MEIKILNIPNQKRMINEIYIVIACFGHHTLYICMDLPHCTLYPIPVHNYLSIKIKRIIAKTL